MVVCCSANKVSSPTNGDETISEGYLASNPYSTIYGDIHYYNYVEDNWDSSIYLTTRFASEYGFQVRRTEEERKRGSSRKSRYR